MPQAEPLFPAGVPAQTQGSTPSLLPPDQTADALETIEFGSVLELVAAHTVGPLGTQRVLSRWPTDDIGWIQEELARVGEIAALFRRGDGLLSEPIPDITRAVSRLRIEGSVLDGIELAGLQGVLTSARLIHADLRALQFDAQRLGCRLAEQQPPASTRPADPRLWPLRHARP